MLLNVMLKDHLNVEYNIDPIIYIRIIFIHWFIVNKIKLNTKASIISFVMD